VRARRVFRVTRYVTPGDMSGDIDDVVPPFHGCSQAAFSSSPA
jgi:hypothetical protein